MKKPNNYINSSEVGKSVSSDSFLNPAVSECWKIPLSNRVKFLLAIKGKSQNSLADEIGINKGTLSKIINGDWMPTAKIKILMAEKLGVDSLVLFGDKQYFLDYQKTIRGVGHGD